MEIPNEVVLHADLQDLNRNIQRLHDALASLSARIAQLSGAIVNHFPSQE